MSACCADPNAIGQKKKALQRKRSTSIIRPYCPFMCSFNTLGLCSSIVINIIIRHTMYMCMFVLITQGGFAYCYELIDTDTNVVYAGKIVSKSMLTKPHQRDKVCTLFIVISSLKMGPWNIIVDLMANRFVGIYYCVYVCEWTLFS